MRNGRRLGAHGPPKPYRPPERPEGKINLSDLDSRNIKTPRGWVQGYNAQAVTTADQMVIAAEVTVDSPDFGHLEPDDEGFEPRCSRRSAQLGPGSPWNDVIVHRLEVAGLPTFLAVGPEPGLATLTFRTGSADEPQAYHGVTHLIEHLALFGVARRHREFNAFVDPLTCAFFAMGDQTELERFLDDVLTALVDLPLERLEDERRVLEREWETLGGDVVSRMLAHRFGIRGFGSNVLGELTLPCLGRDVVEAWRRERFTAGNAALWFHGPRPPALRVALPPGTRQPLPDATPLSGLTFPAFLAEGTGGVAASMLATRTWATVFAVELLRDRLHDRLRLEEALTYHVWDDVVVLGTDRSHVAVGSDCRDDDAARVTELLLDVLDDVAAEGPTDAELAGYRRGAERELLEEPDATRASLDRAVRDELFGAPHPSRDQELDELRRVTPTDVRAVVRDALATLLLVAPDETSKPRAALSDLERPVPQFSAEPVKLKGVLPGDQLHIGEAGIRWTNGKAPAAIAAGELAYVVEGAGGVLTIVGIDGTSIELDPSRMRDGEDAVRRIRRLWPYQFLPTPDPRPGWIEQLAREKLDRRWTVSDELELLPGILDLDEQPLTMAEATRGTRTGLLVVTPTRLLFLFVGLRRDELLRIPIEDIRDARARRRLFGSELHIDVDGDRLEFADLHPKARLEEVLGALRRR
jgi:zinc protease